MAAAPHTAGPPDPGRDLGLAVAVGRCGWPACHGQSAIEVAVAGQAWTPASTLLALWAVAAVAPVAHAFAFAPLPALQWVASLAAGIGSLVPLQAAR